MIVSCPSCNVHYRQVPAPTEAVLAQCSRCDQTFDLQPARAPYRLVPAASSTTPFEARPAFDVPPAISGEPFLDPPPAAGMPEQAAAVSPEVAAEAGADGSTEPQGSRVSVYGVILGLLLAAVCAASGYYLSLLEMTDVVTGTAGGGGVGLLLALAVIRWTMRSR